MKNLTGRIILGIFLFFSIILFTTLSIHRNKSEVWFSNPDQDGSILIDVLRINSGKSPSYLDHPSHGTFIIYGNILKFLEWIRLIPVSRFEQLEKSEDPLMLLPDIFYKARGISIFLCVLCALVFGGIFFVLTRRMIFFVLGAFLLLSSGGLFLQSLIIRSELSSVLFILLAILFIAIEYKSNKVGLNYIYTFISGLFLGFAVLSKVQAIPTLLFLIIYMFCAFIKKDRPCQCKRFRDKLVYIVVIYLFLWQFSKGYFRVLRFGGYSVPFLFKLFLTLIIASGLPICLPKLQKFKVFAFLPKLSLLLVGFLISFYISFYCLNFDSRSESDNKLLKAAIFDRVFNLNRDVKIFGGQIKEGPKGVYKSFKIFL